MKLKEYLEKTGLTQADFGKRVRCSQGYVSLLASGKRSPSFSVALRIQKKTGGAVSWTDWNH